jgi:hypothetical protein
LGIEGRPERGPRGEQVRGVHLAELGDVRDRERLGHRPRDGPAQSAQLDDLVLAWCRRPARSAHHRLLGRETISRGRRRAEVGLEDPAVRSAAHDGRQVDATPDGQPAGARAGQRPYSRPACVDGLRRVPARVGSLGSVGSRVVGAVDRLGGRGRRPAGGVADDDEELADLGHLAHLDVALEQGPGRRRGDLDDRLVGLDLAQQVVGPHGVTDLGEPLQDLGLGDALTDVWHAELDQPGHGAISISARTSRATRAWLGT